uniref:Uncharacterized protein n=1 Tax=Romanomermis culicivorax TaxID=13658 RepID=A0A915II95_ROMCU
MQKRVENSLYLNHYPSTSPFFQMNVKTKKYVHTNNEQLAYTAVLFLRLTAAALLYFDGQRRSAPDDAG